MLRDGSYTHIRAERDPRAGLVRARASLIFTPTIVAFSICAGVNTPSPSTISNAVTPAIIVGNEKRLWR